MPTPPSPWAAPSPTPVGFSILDEQRRMRAGIADITRPDYADVVTITDHPQVSPNPLPHPSSSPTTLSLTLLPSRTTRRSPPTL